MACRIASRGAISFHARRRYKAPWNAGMRGANVVSVPLHALLGVIALVGGQYFAYGHPILL